MDLTFPVCQPLASAIGSATALMRSWRYSAPVAIDTGPAHVENGSPRSVAAPTVCQVHCSSCEVPRKYAFEASEMEPKPNMFTGAQAGSLLVVLASALMRHTMLLLRTPVRTSPSSTASMELRNFASLRLNLRMVLYSVRPDWK